LDQPIHLSVVATSRNDNHGGSLTHRMQHFVDGFVAQCKRHGLRAELILVEWNPPVDRVPLAEELRWPRDPGPCEIRIVTVPREVHAGLENSDKIPLFQMLAKNVGIRRARGKYVLATNIDILFSDASVIRMRDHLRPGCLHRTARVDVPTDVPESEDFGAVLEFCEREGFRIHAPAHTVVREGPRWTRMERWRAGMDPRLKYFGWIVRRSASVAWSMFRFLGAAAMSPSRVRAKWRRFAQSLKWRRIAQSLNRASSGLLLSTASVPERLVGVSRRLLLPWPFTNACGDFTLLSRDDWIKLGGYAEWPVFSWHLDSILLYQAQGAGLREEDFGPDAPIYHIEHGKGSGYTPEGAETLFSSLVKRGIPFLSNAELLQLQSRIEKQARSQQGPLFNGAAWGMADVDLPDRVMNAR